MKLHDAMRKTVKEYGVRVIAEKRLIFILADLRAFEEYPAVKPVLEAVVSGSAGRELVRLFLEEDRDWFLSYAGNLRKSLSGKSRFREDLADYAVGSILFALGVQDSVTEPSDHGFDPMGHGSGAAGNGTGARKARSEEADKGREEGNAGGGAGECGTGVTGREHSGEKEKETQVSRPEAAGSGSAASLNARAKSPSKVLKWVIAAALIAGGFALGAIITSPSHDEEQTAVSRRAEDSVTPHDSAAAGSSDGHDEDQAAAPLKAGSETSQYSGPEPGQYEYEQGEKYYFRNGVGADYWYRKAAEKGHSGAEYRLGWMYEHGEGLVRDYHAALDWYLKAAKKGNAGAEYRLGWMYEQGKGVTPIYEMALRWYRKAAAHGNKDAQAGIVRVEKLISTGSYDRRY